MATYDCDISRFGVRVVQRDILLDGKVQDIFLLIGSCLGIFPNMLARNEMLDDTKLEGHIDGWTAYKGVLRCSQGSALPCRIYRHGYTTEERGNGVFHAEAITALLPAPKPQPAILEWIDATSLLRALANAVYLPRPWYVHSLNSATPVRSEEMGHVSS